MHTWKRTSYILLICCILIGCSFLAGCTQNEPAPGILKTDTGYVSGISQDGLMVYHKSRLWLPRLAISAGDPPRRYSHGMA
jgi:hypothetical protein